MAESNTEAEGALDRDEQRDVEERQQPRALVVYEVIRRQGSDELERPVASLWWSGLAAGLAMGFSLAAQGALHASLPDAPWRPLVADFGYSVGFLLVILSRQQLFTENTLTAVLPVLHEPGARRFAQMLRLWGIVFVANLIGTALFAAALRWPALVPEHLRTGMLEVARQLGEKPLDQVFWRAIPAGWLIATLVWMLPSAETARVTVIIIVTYLISLFELTHVVAGAAEVFFLVFSGELAWGQGLVHFILPTLAGNVIGGSVLFAMLSFGQVKEERD